MNQVSITDSSIRFVSSQQSPDWLCHSYRLLSDICLALFSWKAAGGETDRSNTSTVDEGISETNL